MQIRRKGLALLLAATLTILAGCGIKSSTGKDPSTSAGEDGAPVEITFWHVMDPGSAHGKVLNELVTQYQQGHRNVKINAIFQGTAYGDVEKKLVSAIGAKQVPTIVQVTDSIFAKMAWDGVFEPLAISDADRADYPPSLLSQLTVNGTLSGIPFNRSVVHIIYNKKLIPNPPTTWEEFVAAAKAATDTTAKRYGAGFSADNYQFGSNFLQAGGTWLTDDKKSVTFNSPEGIKALQWMEGLIKAGNVYTNKPGEFLSDTFSDGRVAMIITTSASLAFIKPKNGDPWGAAPLFKGPANGTVSLAGANLVVLKGATEAQKKAANEFLLWITGKEATLKWATGKTGYIPIRKSALADPAWQSFVKANPEWAVLGGDVLERGASIPNVSAWPAVQKELDTAVQKVIAGQADAKTALDAAAQKANELLAKAQ
jgi:ABC-type glycerol-3-phosphate transport system substrate-binding protein